MSFPKDQKIIQQIKSATVSIGLMDMDTKLVGINGSGFIYDSRGYVMTAAHVLNECIDIEKSLQAKGKNVETVVLLPVASETESAVIPIVVNGRLLANRDAGQQSTSDPYEMDVALAKMKNVNNTSYPSIKIKKKPSKIQISDEISMCGFPRGSHSLSTITTKITGVRLSPIIQFGHVGALLPSDNVKDPYGIQTDIIGTSSSSGSPLVDPNTGEVIGLAQNVIPSTFELKTAEKLQGELLVGLVWGDICNRFYDLAEATKDGFDNAHQKKFNTDVTKFNASLGPDIKPPIKE
ncbi:trypsin-like peptidase domain-containing protein [Candidatus Nitrosotalea okcheonensis]|uniref:Trypsin-like peptidase domain-containing protein n=1 Tax=Candidatus Nitrosotalea okcheonensis TaxID=1903276 RepID=A0A2H1FFW2_9ARCH|nr:trypsin-like peptidase domain-containing protein [Candidatus Nitrosotalea okcheonensis]SMH71665.1 protein of unknown function [Candidatus Nitrosotalea okcheonensis]